MPWSPRNRKQRRRHLAPEFPPRRPTRGVTEKLRARSGRETASPLPHPDDRGVTPWVRRHHGLPRSSLCGSSRRPGARQSPAHATLPDARLALCTIPPLNSARKGSFFKWSREKCGRKSKQPIIDTRVAKKKHPAWECLIQ